MPPKVIASSSSSSHHHTAVEAGLGTTPTPLLTSGTVASGSTYAAAAQTIAVASPALPLGASTHPLDIALFTATASSTAATPLSPHHAPSAASIPSSSSSSSAVASAPIEHIRTEQEADALRVFYSRKEQFNKAIRACCTPSTNLRKTASHEAVRLIGAWQMVDPDPNRPLSNKLGDFLYPDHSLFTEVATVAHAAYFHAVYTHYCIAFSTYYRTGKSEDFPRCRDAEEELRRALEYIVTLPVGGPPPATLSARINAYRQALHTMFQWLALAIAAVKTFTPPDHPFTPAAKTSAYAAATEAYRAYAAFYCVLNPDLRQADLPIPPLSSEEFNKTISPAKEHFEKASMAAQQSWNNMEMLAPGLKPSEPVPETGEALALGLGSADPSQLLSFLFNVTLKANETYTP